VRDSVAATKFAESSNVYYLPAPVPMPVVERPRMQWPRLHRVWWRIRFALAGIRLALKPAPTPLFADDDALAVLHGRAELVDRRSRGNQPARVIEFDAARARLRP
jgi:hypothetical protein